MHFYVTLFLNAVLLSSISANSDKEIQKSNVLSTEPKQLFVIISKNGEVTIDKKRSSLKDLTSDLKKSISTDTEVMLCFHSRISENIKKSVLDSCASAGIAHLTVALLNETEQGAAANP